MTTVYCPVIQNQIDGDDCMVIVDVADNDASETETNRMTVHYSKRRTHAVPSEKR